MEFKDADGNTVTLDRLCEMDPGWAASRIRHYMEESSRQRTVGEADLKLAAARSVLQACDAAFMDIQASNYVEDRCRKARAMIKKLGREYQHTTCPACGGGIDDHRRLEFRDDEGRRVTRFECKGPPANDESHAGRIES